MAGQDPHAQCSIHEGEEYHSTPLRSKETCIRKRSPHNIWLLSRSTLLLKGLYSNSLILSASMETAV